MGGTGRRSGGRHARVPVVPLRSGLAVLVGLCLVVCVLAVQTAASRPDRAVADVAARPAPARSTGSGVTAGEGGATPSTSRSAATTSAPSVGPTWEGAPSSSRRLSRAGRITGAISPKSVVAGPDGVVIAQNMIYTHTVTVYGADRSLLATVPDRIVPSEYGFSRWRKGVKGGPVEAAFAPDGKHAWVSNYSMYGPGFSHPGDDVCSPSAGVDRSFLYRVDTDDWKVDGAVLVGSVPKYVAATPDGQHVLVTNWCSWDLSVVDTDSMKVVASVPLGRYPRGIAVSPDSRTAYVAVMGSSDLAVVDLREALAGEKGHRWFRGVGRGPRHLNLSPDGRTLYVTLNADGKVAKVDARTGRVLARVVTGSQPRSAALSPDGTALFVVNYESGTVSRLRTRDMRVVETVSVDHHPIGITYSPSRAQVWVACYVGSITVFDDEERA